MTDSTPTPDAPRVPRVAGGEPSAGAATPGGALGGLLESAQQAFSAQAQAAQQVVEGSAGGGVVSVTMTGSGEVTAVTLAPEVVDPDDIEMLQDLIVAALHDAGLKVTDLQRQALGALGVLDLGGLGDMLGGLTGTTAGAGAGGAIDVGGHDVGGDDDAGGEPDAGNDR
jgi:DNA-binding YbaB/EbfC family protein